MFDRGVPDCITYAEMMDLDPTPSLEAAEAHRYHRDVLILEPWEEIYDTDYERTMSFEQTHPVPRRARRRLRADRVLPRRGADGLGRGPGSVRPERSSTHDPT